MSPRKTRTPAPATEAPQPSDAPPETGELKAEEVEERIAPVRMRLSANHNESVLTQASPAGLSQGAKASGPNRGRDGEVLAS